MGSPSCEERREAARRLRAIDRSGDMFLGALDLMRTLVLDLAVAIGMTDCTVTLEAIQDRLADLIDPPCTYRDNELLIERCRELERENARLKAEIVRLKMADERIVRIGDVRALDEGVISDSNEQAVKVLEEAAEVFGAWQQYDECRRERKGFLNVSGQTLTEGAREVLADELADVITAACCLAFECGIDVRAALDRCEYRNRARGRIGGER